LSYISYRFPQLIYKDKETSEASITEGVEEEAATPDVASETEIIESPELEVDLSELLHYDVRILTEMGKFIIIHETPFLDRSDAFIQEMQHKILDLSGKEEEAMRKKIDDEIKNLRVKVVAQLKFLDKILYTLNAISKHGIHHYYAFFDTCTFFLAKFKDYVDIG
jgi:hypothetical protein